jgi:hypothetical protein
VFFDSDGEICCHTRNTLTSSCCVATTWKGCGDTLLTKIVREYHRSCNYVLQNYCNTFKHSVQNKPRSDRLNTLKNTEEFAASLKKGFIQGCEDSMHQYQAIWNRHENCQKTHTKKLTKSRNHEDFFHCGKLANKNLAITHNQTCKLVVKTLEAHSWFHSYKLKFLHHLSKEQFRWTLGGSLTTLLLVPRNCSRGRGELSAQLTPAWVLLVWNVASRSVVRL